MPAGVFHKLILSCLFTLMVHGLYAGVYQSLDNYSGAWETPATWSPEWTSPQHDIYEDIITIYGYITSYSSLLFTEVSKLTIKDTLVIKGNLSIHDNNQVKIDQDGILIVWGDLIFSDSVQIEAKGYIIVTGDIIQSGTINHGKFQNFNDPSLVFVGGSIPAELTDDNPYFPALNCTAPTATPYPNSTCTYGNSADLNDDPIYSFFMTTCTAETPAITASRSTVFCEGDSVTLNASAASGYLWSTGDTTASITVTTSGSFIVSVTDESGCISGYSDSVIVEVVPLPSVDITSSDTMCLNDKMTLTGSPAGGIFTVIDGPGNISANVLSATATGNIDIVYTYTDECTNSASQSIIVEEIPLVIAGPDQELDFQFETLMNAELLPDETGEWFILSGSAEIEDQNSPVTLVSDLSIGENIFLWSVSNGKCIAEALVTIAVNDLFIPSVITPNGDSKNEFFMIGEPDFRAELIIFNRWGIIEYYSNNYLNDWNGKNNQNEDLPDDTYFYVLKFENGIIRKGSVLIKR